MAAAGPLASLVLAGVFYLVGAALAAAGAPMVLSGVTVYLAGLNVILALFNLVPAFPLDGGRMLRALLWGWRGDLRWATRVAAGIGGGVGLALVLLGVLSVIGGDVIGGMWFFLIGLFVRAAAASSYQQLVAREGLGGVPVARFMCRDPATVSPDMRVSDLVESYFLGRYLKLVPVVDEAGRLIGMVDVRAVKALPRETWHQRRVADILTPISPENTIRPDTDAVTALELMQRTGRSRLLVADGDQLVGIVSLKDMLNALRLRLDFAEMQPSRSEVAGGRHVPELGAHAGRS
jgi:CBS domain-containing protein